MRPSHPHKEGTQGPQRPAPLARCLHGPVAIVVKYHQPATWPVLRCAVPFILLQCAQSMRSLTLACLCLPACLPALSAFCHEAGMVRPPVSQPHAGQRQAGSSRDGWAWPEPGWMVLGATWLAGRHAQRQSSVHRACACSGRMFRERRGKACQPASRPARNCLASSPLSGDLDAWRGPMATGHACVCAFICISPRPMGSSGGADVHGGGMRRCRSDPCLV